ncbi:MAG: helix-turn-helix domain-containing protein [Subdoligranulum sp.]|nr:helix-turn-helix domain-containing protein [Subdoligranulum sp.]
MTIGEKIYKLRRQKGFSQEAVANAVHVSRQAVSKWERNESLPDLDNVRMLCLVLGVSADQLLNEDPVCEADASAAVSLAEFFKEA